MKNIFIRITTVIVVSLFALTVNAQQVDLFKTAQDENKKEDSAKTEIAIATFKNSRLINGHTIETLGKGMMDFRVHHRFGYLNEGIYTLFGLDEASTLLGLDYGITNKLMIGLNRSTYQKQMEGFLKYRLIRQSSGKVNMPLSVTVMAAMIVKTVDLYSASGVKYSSNDKTCYTAQVLIASKLSDKTSLQIMPTFVHYNIVPFATDKNDMFSIGFGGRQKISRRISINAEYYYQINKFADDPSTGLTYYNSLAVGVDIETGGHVFQLHFTNSTGMTEPTFIHETTGDFFKGNVHFGFNISRVFVIKKPKQFKP
jgi:hypothetical protein